MKSADIFIMGRNKGKLGTFLSTVIVLEGGESWYRCIRCGNLTTNQAELKGIELATLVINPEVDVGLLRIHVGNRYIAGMMRQHDEEWEKIPQTNVGIVNRVRDLVGKYKYQILEVDKNNKHYVFAKEMLEKSVNECMGTDQKDSQEKS